MKNKRVFLIVLDSFGVGEAPDSKDFGDEGSDTLKAISQSKEFDAKILKSMGLFNIDGIMYENGVTEPTAAFGKATEVSRGKDTTIGHWEIAGLISETPFPTYPDGFPAEIIEEFSKRTGRDVLCNKPYSGTEVIKVYGEEHLQTGALIVYTSADSVFQIAAHEDVVSVEELYKYCEIAREILVGDNAVARVIARPFVGKYPDFTRTSNRHDFSLVPPKDTMLNLLKEAGFDVISVGKINDIFAGSGITESTRTVNNANGMEVTDKIFEKDFTGLCFVNLVEFDSEYGHRRNPVGYYNCLKEANDKVEELLPYLREDDLLMITADHGNDPSFRGTDHTREMVPLVIYNKNIKKGFELKEKMTYADIGATIIENFKLNKKDHHIGTSLLEEIKEEIE